MKKEEKKPLTKEEKRKEIFRAIKFTLFAASAGLVEYGSFTIFTLLPGYNNSFYWEAALASLILSVIWNFTFNRKFTFQSATNVKIAMIQVLAYYAIFAPLSIWFAQMYLIDTLGWNEFLVKGGVMFVNFVTEFAFMRFVVFGKSLDTNSLAQKQKEKEVQKNNEQ